MSPDAHRPAQGEPVVRPGELVDLLASIKGRIQRHYPRWAKVRSGDPDLKPFIALRNDLTRLEEILRDPTFKSVAAGDARLTQLRGDPEIRTVLGAAVVHVAGYIEARRNLFRWAPREQPSPEWLIALGNSSIEALWNVCEVLSRFKDHIDRLTPGVEPTKPRQGNAGSVRGVDAAGE